MENMEKKMEDMRKTIIEEMDKKMKKKVDALENEVKEMKNERIEK